jgi:predicted ATPase/DNA-binding CsgD family transcriptional regulator
MTQHDLARRPEEFSTFVGRATEVDEVRALIGTARAVTLCGAGGIGKTRLALRLLAAVADSFPDGAWFVELGDIRQAEHLVPRVAAAVGVTDEPGRELTDTLAGALRHRRAILVLDNCEHLVQASASLCQRLLASSPGLQVIATSREPLRVAAEAVWQVPPLSLPPATAGAGDLADYDAVRLFAERAGAASPGFALGPGNAAVIARICRALDGLPLALELAAAWVRVLSADQIAARLHHRLALLTSTDRSVPARQQTLRAACDWSYDLLSAAEQLLLRRMSVFSGWSLDMAEQVCSDESLPADDIMDLLTGLADKSLVEVEPEALGEARFRMLETIREYAAERLAAAGEAALLQRRRLDYTLREAEQAAALGMATIRAPWSARVDVFRRVDLEAANLREVLAGCLADGDAESGLRICTAIRPVWLVRGAFAEGAQWFDGFLGLPAAIVSPAVRGSALVGRAQLAMANGDERAEELAVAGLEVCWAGGEKFWIAAALNLLTEIAMHSGQAEVAAARAAEALSVARSAGDRWNEGYALGTMAAAAARRGNLQEAQRSAEQSLAIMQDIEQHWGSARTLLGLGDLARLQGDTDLATRRYLAALDILREVDARPEIARCLAGLGRIALDLGDVPAARRHLAESLRLSYASGSRLGLVRGLEMMARLGVLEGEPGAGVQLAAAVTALRAEAHLPPLAGARTQRFLDAAARLGEHTVGRLWAAGLAMTSADAVRLALGEDAGDSPAGTGQAPVVVGGPDAAAGGLTPREHEVVALLGAGLSNREIARELFISPATAARHVANILAKLDFSSRSQVAVWASTGEPAGQLAPNRALTDSPS